MRWKTRQQLDKFPKKKVAQAKHRSIWDDIMNDANLQELYSPENWKISDISYLQFEHWKEHFLRLAQWAPPEKEEVIELPEPREKTDQEELAELKLAIHQLME